MMQFLVTLALLAGFGAQREDAMQVALVRFFSPGTGTTTVEGTSEIRLDSLLAGGGGRYRVEIAVRDSAGLELLRNDWAREVPAGAVRVGATAIESFSFSAAPGLYRVLVRASREGSPPIEREVQVRAYGNRPVASDLLLASRVRRPAADSEALGPGEVRRAGLVMQTGPIPRVSPTEPTLTYYAELYPWQSPVRGELRAEVVARDGRVLVSTPARALEVGSAGGLSRGALDLTGLPEGTYRLRLRLTLGDSSVVAEAPFTMGSLATALAQAAPAAPVRAEDQLLDGASEAQLDSLFGPLVHLLGPEEYQTWGTLAVEGRRRFLKSLWQRRDPTPQTPDNPAMQDFYRAVRYANETFRETGSGAREGWRTDRGRIFLRFGRPSEILSRPSASEPYEVWKYTRDRTLYYVFLDRSGFAAYRLIGTNDRAEPSQMDWERRVSSETLQDVMQFIR